MLYPIMLNMKGKQVVVVGGGKIAHQKIIKFLDTGANVTVVAPNLYEKVEKLVAKGKVTWKKENFSPEVVVGATLVFAATNDRKVNAFVRNSCTEQLVSTVDDANESDFHVPALYKKGRLTIAVSTGGASPIIAKKIAKEIGERFDDELESFLDFLFEARQEVKATVSDEGKRKALLRKLANGEITDWDSLKQRLEEGI